LNGYKTVAAPVCAEFVEKRSRFIAYLSPVRSREQAEDWISSIKKKNKDATHNVPVYRLFHTGIEHYSDDGEPQGTAGQPALSVLQNEEMFDVCLVITRYFGGILLGGGGLVRAYSNSAALAIKEAKKVLRCNCERISFKVPYNLYGKLQFFLSSNNLQPLSCDYKENIIVEILVREEASQKICAGVTDLSAGQITFSSYGVVESDYPL